ncbi:superoxide dismutase family protein [Microbispora hainanensis]|jgi:Cu-Zn family superoxide dismutase|uniref:Superoxide dismutase family protein n=1 Tax=Microbispora hainanensis TaxID=568844 RepID=A0ABZ1T0V4_9ACTN|nr:MULTISPECIES: superoxide dismutase family protein [Microbispora]NJP24843.1 superoxide dismutase [Microbispora sp. CL1-1]TQS14305.1 superoxide dismutase [Microbispora sp. SCL1-1]
MLRHTYLSLAAAVVAGAAVSGAATAQAPMVPRDVDATATLTNAQGQNVGTVQVENDENGGTEVKIRVTALPPGFHGMHIHDKAVCDPNAKDPATGSPFSSAGSHLGSGSHPGHAGDLPDLLVRGDGVGQASYVTDRFTVEDLLSGDGSSIIIHAKPDNHANIPGRYSRSGPDAETLKAGDSGGRIACGVFRRD